MKPVASFTSFPFQIISPLSLGTKPRMARNKVVLPEPILPVITVTDPFGIINDIPSIPFSVPGYLKFRFFISNAFSLSSSDLRIDSNGGYSFLGRTTGLFNWTDDPSYNWVPEIRIEKELSIGDGVLLDNTWQTYYTVPDGLYVDHVVNHSVTISGIPTNMPAGIYDGPNIFIRISNPDL